MTAAVAAAPEHTISQKVLLAAARLEALGHSPFSAEALIVNAWQAHPRAFGLKGFADQHPDSNRVLACIMGEKGLARRGWLTKVGQKLYTLSATGRAEAARLAPPPADAPKPAKPAPRSRVPRELEKEFLGLAGSPAYRRFQEGMKRELTYRDAFRFWNITDATHGEAVARAAGRVPEVLAEMEALLVDGVVTLSNGRAVDRNDIKVVADVHDYLSEQFGRHLALRRQQAARN